MARYTNSERLSMANIIYKQLGGGRFSIMTGCKFLGCTENEAGNIETVFKLTRNATSANRFSVEYDSSMDLYNVRFYRETKNKFFDITKKMMKEYEGVYCDMLEGVFTKFTGLATRL